MNTPTSLQSACRSDTGLAAELRVSVARLSRRLRSERAVDDDLTVSQRSVLAVLMRQGESTVGELAEAEKVRRPSMTRTVAHLADAGFVLRRTDPDDRRVVRVAISGLGEQTMLADRRKRDAWLAKRLRELTPEQRDLLRRAAPVIESLAHA